jgi:hypothetical protein
MADSDDSGYREVLGPSPDTHGTIQLVTHAPGILRAERRSTCIGNKRKKNNEMVGKTIRKKQKKNPDETTIDFKREIAWKLCKFGYMQKATAKNRWKGFYKMYNDANPKHILTTRKAEYSVNAILVPLSFYMIN